MSFATLYNPPVFQGNLRRKNYFEGWYFKHVSENMGSIISIIPGLSLSADSHAFIQIIDGITGQSDYYRFPVSSFEAGKSKFYIRIGDNLFSNKGISIDLSGSSLSLKGKLEYLDPITFPTKVLAPGIMGWYAFVPFMECYHGVVSINHRILGNLSLNNSNLNFSEGKGYIEKDWGVSFPECWVWTQGNSFDLNNCSLMMSVAKIPWMGKFFIGHLCFLWCEKKLYLFATYTGSKRIRIERDENHIYSVFEDKKYRIEITSTGSTTGRLKAPVFGSMERYIKESVNSVIQFRLMHKNGALIHEGICKSAGLEVVGDIWKYL